MAQYAGIGVTDQYGQLGPTPQSTRDGTSPWVGWIAFAGTMLVMLGTFHVVEGIVALTKNSYFTVPSSGLMVAFNWTTWGWVQIIAGCIVVAAGVGVFRGWLWARIVGVGLAFLSALISLGFLAANPLWAILMIVFAVLVIMALTVHGSDLARGA